MSALSKFLRENTEIQVFSGITLSLIGLLCVAIPFISGVTFASFVSLTIIAAGLTMSAYAFTHKRVSHVILAVIAGLLVAMIGGFMLYTPVINLFALTTLSISYFLVDGTLGLVTASKGRLAGRGWSLFSAVISLVLAGLLISEWPISSFYVVCTLMGIRLIFTGFNVVLFASTDNSLISGVEDTVQDIAQVEQITETSK